MAPLDSPGPRSVPDLARHAADIEEELGAGLEVAGWVGGEWFRGGPGTVLRPGSITKVMTATAVMQCVDEELLRLEDDVTRWVPHLRQGIRIEHLLTHSSGIDAGDMFVDTGDDEGAIGRYVDLLKDVPSLFDPGYTCSYNNAGMVVAGHILSLARQMTYEDAIQRFVFDRAEMETAGFDVERNGNPICSRALTPAGAAVVCSATDLVRLATCADLVTPDRAAWMRTLQIEAPGGVIQNAGFGLGWQVWRNEFGETARHSGAYPGRSATLVHDHTRDAAIAFMSPLASGINATNPLLDRRGAVVTDVAPPSLAPYVGTYASQTMTVEVQPAPDADGLQLALAPFPALPIEVVDRQTFTLAGEPFAFFDFDDAGAPRFMRFRMRVQRRVS